MALAATWRFVILASNAVSFHSDEAIIGLMARHILQGQPIPTFFYGQAYMGSLDALLVSLSFRVFGESVLSIRLVQSALYLLTVGTTMLIALRLSNNRTVAAIVGVLMALPSPLVALYTTISLGGYGETLLIGNLLLLTACEISLRERWNSWQHWLVLGGLVGLGWWTNNLIVVYIFPVAILMLRSWRHIVWSRVGGAALAFFVFSAPWWLYNFTHDWESIHFLSGGFQPVGGGLEDRLLGFLLLGLPAVIGVRYSWAVNLWASLWVIPLIILYVGLLVAASRRASLMWWMLVGIIMIFVGSSFGVDATGRYLLPMIIPLSILLAFGAQRLQARWMGAMLGLIMLLIGTNVIGTGLALRTIPPGLTPQFDPATDFTNDYDQQVIDFLHEHGGQYGYATYWASYRLAFLSHETIILSPQLPYKASLVYTSTERYPAYTDKVAQAKQHVFVTVNLPALDAIIAQKMTGAAITYTQQAIGPYTVFYDISKEVTPAELGLQDLPAVP
ncbi:MAG: glycosyltransferase family 39 protein [Chloroflexota bacterium]